MRWTIALLPLFLIGCGDDRTSVHGTVTANGEPVAHGHVLFQPAEGESGQPGGADIVEGRYEIRQISPGKKRVIIKSLPTPKKVPATNREAEHVELVSPNNPIPLDAQGNGVIIEIHRGDQKQDFDVKYVEKKR
jgi:hypothetical protein